MAYESVKNQIDAYIKANGVNLITGPVLNAVLTTMLDELGEGYAFQGILNTTDTPSPAADIPQAWLASAGTYLGGSITVDEGELALIIHTADGWSKETIYRGVQLSFDAIVSALGYTPADEDDLAEKQDTIADLSAIRSGAALGETSVQPVDIENMVEAEPIGSIIPPVNPSEFATKEEVSQLSQEVTDSGNDVTDLNDTVFTENETTQPVVLSTYYQGIIRHSTLMVGSTSDTVTKLYYFPVVAGRKYNLSGTNIYVDSSGWDLIGFSTEIPTSGVSYEPVLSPTSAGNNTYNEEFIPSENGYLLVHTHYAGSISDRLSITETSTSKTSNIGDLSELVTTEKENLVAAINEIAQNEHSEDIGDLANLKTTAKANIVASMNELYGASSVVTSETTNRVTLSNYVASLIMRNTSLKFDGSSSEDRRVIYVPVVAGRRYVIRGTNVSIDASSWSLIGFSTTIPSRGGSYVDVLSPESSGNQTYEKDYVAVSDGYLCIYFGNALAVLDRRLQVYEYIGTQKYAIPLVLGGKVSSVEDAKTALANGELSFNIGLTNLRSVTKTPDILAITASGSNYNDCIKQYINTQDGRKTSKFIPTGVVNLDPHIGDFSTLGTTYWREVIGVDSEGWIYCAQRKYSNLSTDANVNIYKTKDFENFEVFKANSCGHQLIELENGELCLATYETETVDGTAYIRCFIYVTSGHKTVFNKKFYCTQIGQYNPASPWSWGIQSRGKVVAVGEYGQHGQCGKVWYSRDYGENFYEVFDLRDKAPDVPHAHIHGICIDPYFDRLYIINGDGSPASSPELLYKNPRIWYWDYDGETLSDNLKNTIDWQYANVGEDVSLGSNLQFVCGYALKDCILLSSDGSNNGIFRINRGRKEDVPTIDFAHHLGIETDYTKFCGGNMFRKDENSPLFVCVIREYSCDLDPVDPENPSNKPNTYKDVLSRVYSTYDGYHFEEVWIDDTYGTYTAHYSGGTSEQRNLAKCGRDMCVWQLPSGEIILKYIGRDFTYVAYNNNGVTAVTKVAYVDFANYVAKFIIK